MLFSNLAVAIALTVLFPLGLMGLLAAGEWLERRTLATGEEEPRRPGRKDGTPPEAVEDLVLETASEAVTPQAAVPGAASNGGRHLRRPAPGRAGRHERRR